MTPPLTDAELLAYIERTPEWSVIEEMLVTEAQVRIAARAFYDHEQRVREETALQEFAVAEHVLRCLTSESSFKKISKRLPVMIEEGRALNGSTAPQLSTAGVSTAPSPEGVGQGEAAEAVGLLREVFDAYIVGVGSHDRDDLFQRVFTFLAKKGGR